MSQNSPSHNLEEILAGYVLGDLDEAELLWLNEQLKVNPQLQAQIAQLQTTLTLMPYSLPEDAPQQDLRAQILRKARTEPQTRYFNFASVFSWNWVVSAIALLGAVWLGANNFSLRQQLAIKKTQLEQRSQLIDLLHQPNNRLVNFQGANDIVPASGSLFIFPAKNKAILALQNLEPLPGNQVYRLWAVSQKQKTGCANFTPNDRGIVHLELSSDEALANASSVLITIEPEADTEQPLGSEFLTSSESTI